MASEPDNPAVDELQTDLPSQGDGAAVAVRSNNVVSTSPLLSLPTEIRQLILTYVCMDLRPLRLRHVRAMAELPETPPHHRAAYAKKHLNHHEQHAYAQLRGLGRVCHTFQQDLLYVEELWFSRRFALDLDDFGRWVNEAIKIAGKPENEAASASLAPCFSTPLPAHLYPEQSGSRGIPSKKKDDDGAGASSDKPPLHSRGNLHITLLLFDADFVNAPPLRYSYLASRVLAWLWMQRAPPGDRRGTPVVTCFHGDGDRQVQDFLPATDAFAHAWTDVLRRLTPAVLRRAGVRGVEIVNTRRMARVDAGTGHLTMNPPPPWRVKEGRRVPGWMLAYLRVTLEMLGLPDAVWVEHEDVGEGGRLDWS